MKKRKTLLMALICPLMLAGMISTAFISMLDSNALKVEASEITESSYAKIGTEGYESLEDAINAVQNNETIVVIKDFTYDTPITINNGKTFTIDFNDGSTQHSFRWFDMMGSQTDKDIFTIDDNSNVTVKNMRYLVGVGEIANRVFNVNSTATLTLTNMICSSDDNIKDIPVRNNGGTVIIDGGDITTYAPGGANLLSPVVQNLNNGTTTITGNGTFTMKNNSTGVAWLGNIVTMASSSTDADQENPCGTVIIENGTFNNGHIVDVNGKGTVIINDGTLTTGIGPAIKTFHGGVKSKITVNNITTSTMVFAQVLEEPNTKIDFQNGNVKFTRFCIDSAGKQVDYVSIANGKFGPKSGTTDIHDVLEGFLADGAVISALTDNPDGYTYKVEIPHVHTYGTPTPSWNGNELTLTTSCSCGDEQSQTFTGTYTKVSDATCTAKETGKYVVTIAEGIFAGTYESSVFETGNPLGHHATYRKVTSELADYSGDYLIVYEDGNSAFDGSLETLDASSNTQAVTIAEDGTIKLSEAYEFHIASKEGGYSIQSSSGLYIGKTADSNGLDSKETDDYVNTISYVEGETPEMDVVGSGGAYLRYNANSGQERFRFYKSTTYTGQKAIALYRKVTVESVEALILSETNGYCSSYKETDPSSEIKALYEAKWTLIKPFYDALSSEEKAQMVSGSDEALTRYDHINAKYSIENGFISGRAVAPGRYVPTSTAEDSNVAIAVVAIVAVASISAIAVILIIKRRKAFDR